MDLTTPRCTSLPSRRDLVEQIILDLLLFDSLRAIAPLVLVFLVVWFQTRSIFIALVTIVECILSCTASVFVLCAVGIQWMAFEMFLAIYIVLAIGADDVRPQLPRDCPATAPHTRTSTRPRHVLVHVHAHVGCDPQPSFAAPTIPARAHLASPRAPLPRLPGHSRPLPRASRLT